MNKLSPVKFVAIAAVVVDAAVFAQPFAPPPPPPLKSGTFSCTMHDRGGHAFALKGEMGNWQVVNETGQAAVFILTAPDETGLSGRYRGNLSPRRMNFFRWDAEKKISVDGELHAGFSPEGTITIEQQQLNGSARPSTHLYVGICDTTFSTGMRELGQ